MKTSVGRTKIEVASSDITQLEVDALATPSSIRLEMDHGVGAVVKAAGGEAIEIEAMLQGPIELGSTVVTTGHDLKARWVIHVALTEGITPHTTAEAIAKATRETLVKAERCHARSVAMPAYGTGACGFPMQQCAALMVAETVAYLRKTRRSASGLRHVMFAVLDDVGRAAFQHALAGASRL